MCIRDRVLTVQEQSISVLHFVPSMLSVFVDHLEKGSCSSLCQIVAAGEGLSGTLQEETFNALPHTTLFNWYGPTEAAIYCSAWQCRPGDKDLTPPIGSPIWNTQLYILDPTLTPVPDGISGELYIGCLLYTSPSPRDKRQSRMPSSA